MGYSSFPEVAALAEKGLISGVYITRHNVAGSSSARLKEEIAALQEKRRAAGLPPLIVAADQEGGIVSHLAPPLTKLPALSTLASLAPDVRAEKAEAFGRTHGQELAALGVNQNLAPVLDLRPEPKRNRLDFNTLIGQRAISDDPAVVADIARAYVNGLEASGVGATVKHFPGLGRVRTDTHHFSADLDTPLEELEASDWIPFRKVLAGSKAQLMIGHVTLTSVDPDRPASHSKRVVDGIVRKKWNYQGVVMTDDLVMGAIYQRNVCTAVVEALNAGVDLLLVAFDGAQFYRIFSCAVAASAEGRLDAAMLGDSEVRLKGAFPGECQMHDIPGDCTMPLRFGSAMLLDKIDRASLSEASAARTIRKRRAPSQSALLRRNAGILDDMAPSVDFALEDGFERCRCRAFLLDRATLSSAKLTKGGSLSAFCRASTNGRKVVNGAERQLGDAAYAPPG